MKKLNKKTIICALVATILAVVTNIATIIYYEPEISESEIAEIKVDVVEDVEVEDVEDGKDGVCKHCEEMHNLHFEEVRV